MNQPTLIDFAIGLAALASLLGACHRGIGREMLHTVMFMILVAIGYVMFKTQSDGSTPADVVFWVVNSSYYLITAYVLTWVVMKIISPLVIGHETVGLRSRFWAGVLCMVKLLVVVFGLNLWFAVHSPDAHPLRLNSLPPIMRDSMLIQLSDKTTDELYQWLASKKIIEYHKTLERKDTDTGSKPNKEDNLEQMLGLPSSGAGARM